MSGSSSSGTSSSSGVQASSSNISNVAAGSANDFEQQPIETMAEYQKRVKELSPDPTELSLMETILLFDSGKLRLWGFNHITLDYNQLFESCAL